jgi:iron(III) transport system substrate-binding protein
MAAKGEFPIGISFAYKGAQLKSKGAPIEVIAPKEGLGWDVEAFGIIKSSENKEAAKRFADWSVTKEANVIYNKGYAVVALDGVAQPVKNYPEEAMGLMIDNDFLWAAANRTRILKEWETRYGTKSEAK